MLVAGVAAGEAARRLRLPSVTGQILVGLLIGPAGFGWMGHGETASLRAVIDFALGLMAVATGSHLSLRRLANAKRRLGLLVAAEATVTPLVVGAVLLLVGGVTWPAAALLATICVSTAPATTLALVKEARARGVFTKTLLAGVALNNLACITLFEVARTLARVELGAAGQGGAADLVLAPLRQLALSAALGGGAGVVLVALTKRVYRTERTTALSLLAILLVSGVSAQLGVSTLLSGLFLGIALANLTPDKEEIGHAVFANFEYAIFAVFFTVAGTELSPSAAAAGGGLALAVFAARLAGKSAAAWVAMRLAGATRALRRLLGAALVPQAGLAVGLMLLVTEDPELAPLHGLVLSVVLTVVLLNEIVGPVLGRAALSRSGEAGLDRPRVLDFLDEEHIVTGLRASTLEEAIERLSEHLARTAHLGVGKDGLLRAALEREAEQSTCLGEGLAVPHARLASGTALAGAMGILQEGLDVPTPDGRPLHFVVLLATPQGQAARHLQVLAALAHLFGSDPGLTETLRAARTPAHAYGILHAGDGTEGFNQFLDEPER